MSALREARRPISDRSTISIPASALGRTLTRPRLFGDILAARVAERESQIVLGLDPDPGALWPGAAGEPARGSPAERAGAAVAAHCRTLIDATAPACVAVKLQLACFERLGAPGWSALETVTHSEKKVSRNGH